MHGPPRWGRHATACSRLQVSMHRVELGHRFPMRRAGADMLTYPPLMGHGLYAAAGLGAVMGQQFRLPLGDLWKTFNQRLGDLRMILLPRALE
jgi:hypothetical protein